MRQRHTVKGIQNNGAYVALTDTKSVNISKIKGNDMSKKDIIKNYTSRIEESLSNVYSNGYAAGYEEGKKEIDHLRSTCKRIKGEHDNEYAKNWDDDSDFYGWCSKCERPHSGRWAHIWEFCPWCGARIDHNAENPYPMGMDVTQPEKTSIKPIENIPDVPQKITQRDLIRKDIKEALSNKVSQFELINDAYKYDTLAQNTKSVLEEWFRGKIFCPAYKNAKERLKTKITEPFWGKNWFEYKQNVFKVSKRKLEDRVHVYVTINLDFIDNIERTIYEDTLKLFKDKWPEKIIGEKNE